MSSTAPPVPTGEGTTVDPDLVGSGPISKLRAGEEQTKGPLTSHVGQSNRPDRYIYDHFIQLATFTWSTTQLPGTLLFSVPIHPARMNWVISYLTALYNTWSGGFQFALKVAGTGFHAGAITFARIPPNRDPETITNPQDFSVFEWSFMDPKELDLKGFQVMDQKPFEYHYNPLNVDNPNSFGGWFTAYVHLPLATSSTGNQQISVMVLNKADENFNVAQIVPLVTQSIGVDYRDYENILPPYPTFIIPCDWRAAQYLSADPTLLVANPDQLEVQSRLDGSDYGEPYVPLRCPFVLTGPAVPDESLTNGIASPFCDKAFPYHYRTGRAPTHQFFALASDGTYNNNVGSVSVSAPPTAFPSSWGGSLALRATDTSATLYQPALRLNSEDVPDLFVPNANETIVLFRSGGPATTSSTILSSQTEQMYRILKALAQRYSWTHNNALLFTLVHRSTELPVAYLKLYFEGVFTTSPLTTVTTWRIADYSLSFQSVTSRNSLIPQNALFAQNAIITGAASALKEANARIDTLSNLLAQEGIGTCMRRTHPRVPREDDERDSDVLP